MKHFMRLIGVITILFMLAACGPRPTPEPTATPTDLPPTETPEPSSTPTDSPTETPEPSATPIPTDTPEPTATEEPTETGSGSGGTAATAAPTSSGTNPTQPPATTAAPPPSGGQSFVPLGDSQWVLSTQPTAHNTNAACAAPIDLDFYGLANIHADTASSILWTRPSGSVTLGRDPNNPNLYVGSAADNQPYGGYRLTVIVVFYSPQSLTVGHSLTDLGNPDCKHYFEYSATPR